MEPNVSLTHKVDYVQLERSGKRKEFWSGVIGAGIIILAILTGWGVLVSILMISVYCLFLIFRKRH